MSATNQPERYGRRRFIKTAAGMGLACAWGFDGLAADGIDKQHAKLSKRGLASSLSILTMWGEKPQAVLDLYEAIYNALEADTAASLAAAANDPKVKALVGQLGLRHLGGPMLGCLGSDHASVWVRTAQPAEVSVVADFEGGQRTFGPVRTSVESDLVARVRVEGLAPGSSTPYKVLVDREAIDAGAETVITTPPAGMDTPTRIAFATCPHRWGLGNEKQADTVLGRKPHALLLYGDVAVQDRGVHLGLHRADYALRDFHPAWRKLAGRLPIYTSWDDHDYADNDAWGLSGNRTEADRRGIRTVFLQSWNNPGEGLGDSGGGIFQHTRIGACDIIMTDNRYFRTSDGKHCFLGTAQMEWLKKTLLACKGPFIILSCGTMWSDYVSGGKDSWGKFDPEGREEIFHFIEEHKIPGVLLLSGDRHGARGFRIPRPSGYEFYEFEPASFGGRGGPSAVLPGSKDQLFGISYRYAFGEFSIDASKADPEVTFRLIDSDDGSTIYELTLTRSQLTPGA